MSLRDTVDAVRQTRDYARLVDAIPYARFLGVAIEDVDGGRQTRLPFREELIGNFRIRALHGGVLGSLLELSAQLEIMLTTDTPKLPKTISVTVDYLRSGRAEDLLAKPTIVKHGRRVMVVRVDCFQENETRLVASANVHLLIAGRDTTRAIS